MNYGLVVVLLIALVIFTVIATALMFYVRHWASRQAKNDPSLLVTEGRFVKRYIPPSLRPRYDEQRAVHTPHTTFKPRSIARVMNVVIAALVLAVVGSALAVHRYRLMAPIDLSQSEVMELRSVQASWLALPETGLPGMEQRAALLRKQGVAVVASLADEGQVINGQRITSIAENHWRQFFARWDIPYRLCGWEGLSACMGQRVGIVMPGTWEFGELEWALSNGASLILYGPPTSVLTKHQSLEWQGLKFEPFSNESELRFMVLRGDQLLTLGFDAGLIIEADRAFKGYRVFSDSPQAIGINAEKTMGGVVDTRLYAKRVGKGRLVWMDYAPDQLSQPENINVQHLQAASAAVFRYLLGESYSSWATWPDGKRFAGVISEDSEDKFHLADSVVQMVDTHGFPITWFILTNEAQLNRSLTERMAEVGEVACHGDSHVPFPLGSLPTQTERLARCIKVLSTITGETPKGFRPPEEKFNGDTINAVASIEMSYYMADANMDRMVPRIMRENGGIRELVSLPRMGSDDYEMWYTLKLNGEESLRLAEEELFWINVIGGFLPFSFHTQYMDKEENLAVVEHYGRRFQQADCYFATAGQIADWWRVRTKLMNSVPVDEVSFLKYRPVRLRVNALGELTRAQAETVTASRVSDNTGRLPSLDGREDE